MLKFFKLKREYFILLIIFSVAAILRLYKLSTVPPGIHWDEAAWGYNAYSIWQTGRDEHGTFLPLVFKSFGDFKPGLYFYLTAPSITIFGLSEFAVRLPSVLASVASSVLLFFLVRKLFGQTPIALLASFFFAISPWGVMLSRPAFDNNVATLFLLAGVLLFLYAVTKPYFLIFSAASFLLSLYSYQTAKLIVPGFILALVILYRDKIFKIPKLWLVSFFLILLLSFPLYFGFVTGQGGRFEVMSLFSYPPTEVQKAEILKEDSLLEEDFYYKLFHGDWYHFLRGFILRYSNHFSPSFLFFEGDTPQNPRQGVPIGGVLYYFDILFLLIGLTVFLRSKNSPEKFLVLFWLFLGPLPAALTRDLTQNHRALTLLPALQILIGFGAYTVFSYLKKQRFSYLTFAVLGLVIFWNLLFFLDQYFIHMPKKNSADWLSANKEMAIFLAENSQKFDKVVVSDKFGQPYIYYLFYSKYDPGNYQKQNSFVPSPVGDVGQVPKLDNIEFRPIFWPKDRGEKNTLFIGTEFELPPKDIQPFEEFKILGEIYFKNTNQLAYRIVESK